MDRVNFQNRQHISLDNLISIYDDVENFISEILTDLYPASGTGVITGLSTAKTSPPSFGVVIGTGRCVINGQRTSIDTTVLVGDRTLSWLNNAYLSGTTTPNTNQWRKDLVYIKFSREESDALDVRFLLESGIFSIQEIFTRLNDYFELGVVIGVQAGSQGAANVPATPDGTYALAYVTSRPGATIIYNTDGEGSNLQAFITDLRTYLTFTVQANQIRGELADIVWDGTLSSFSLSHTPIASSEAIYVNGIRQIRNVDYTIAGAAVSFLSPPYASSNVLSDYDY